MAAVDDYLVGLGAAERAAFERVLDVARELAPGAEQGTSYGMAALRYRGRPLLGFRAAQTHLSLFPFSPAVLDAVRHRLVGLEPSKGTIRFTVDAPIPESVLTDLVRLRMAEIDSAS